MEKRDIIIVGAGPSGLSAAIFSRLDGWDTSIFESRWVGGQGEIAYIVSNYPGFTPGDGSLLIDNLRKQATQTPPDGLGAELKMEEVSSIDTKNMKVTTDKNEYVADVIILATGSKMKKLCIPGEEKFMGQGVSYYGKLDYNKFQRKKVIVVGGGNSTIKNALLAKKEGRAEEVIIIHRRDSMRAYPVMVKKMEKAGIEVMYNTELIEIKGNSEVETIRIKNNRTEEEKDISADWIVICVGTEPDIELAREAGIKIEGDFIEVNEKMMTDKEGIFACGEISGCDNHLINATYEGTKAGKAASEYLAIKQLKSGKVFKGARNGKYMEQYLQMIEENE